VILIANSLGKGITIYDVAKKANVSISTVSRVFNGNASVSKKTRKKVQKAIEELNYIPNALARGLVCQSSKTIGLVVSDLSNPFFTNVIDGIESILSEKGFSALLCDTHYSFEKEIRYISQMLEKRVDGIIIFDTNSRDVDLINRVKNIIPIVSVQSNFKGVDSINTTDDIGAYEAVDYLIKLGHKKIAFLVYDNARLAVMNRLKGYVSAHRANGIPINRSYIINPTDDSSSKNATIGGYCMANELFDRHPEVTAIFAYNDAIAVGACLAANERGLKIPDDINIVGFDDIEMASLINPKLTTVAQPLFDMGKNAAELILKKLREGKESTTQIILLPTSLVIRESTKQLQA
jgi:LacI family transcriptional regulator